MVGGLIDKFIGVFSPTTELNRLAAREALTKVRSQYAASKTSLSTGKWLTSDTKINTILQNSLPALQTRAEQLVRDMPAMATAIDRLTDFTVGTELTLQSRVKDPDTGKLMTGINQKIEDAWRFWCDQADDAGNLHFAEIQQLCNRQENIRGEYIIVKKRSRARGRFLPFSLMLLETSTLTSQGAKTLPGNEVELGVEYNTQTGRKIAYYFEDAERWNKPKRIPAEQTIMGYKTLRPYQLRGVSPLAPVILLAHSLRDFIEAEVATAQKAARWLAFVNTPDPAATMSAFGAAASSTYSNTDGNSKYTMEMGNAIVDFLTTGESVTIANHNRPGDAFTPFIKWFYQTFAATVGVTYELVSGDYNSAKYTGARLSRNDMIKGVDIKRARLVRQLCNNVRKEFMDWAVLTGKLDLPGYFSNPLPYLRAGWMSDGVESIDPLREGRATNDAIDIKREAPQESIIKRGEDPEAVLDQWKEWDEMLDERGLKPEPVSVGLNTNPAAVGAEEGDGQK